MTARLVRRHLLAHARELALLGAVVATLALLAGALPRATDHLLTTNLRHQIRELPAAERDLSVDQPGAPVPGPDDIGTSTLTDPGVAEVWGTLDGALTGLRADMPAALRSVLGPPSFAVLLAGGPAAPADPGSAAAARAPDARLLPAFDPRLAEHVRITAGAMPGRVRDTQPGPGPVELVLSDATAKRLHWPVGATWTVTTADAPPITVLLSGTYRPIDPADPIWRHVGIALEPSVSQRGLADPIVTGVGWVDPASYPKLVPVAANAVVPAWFPLDVDAVDAHDAADLSAQLREAGRVGVTLQGPETLPDFRGAPQVYTLQSLGFGSQTVDAIQAADRSGTSTLAMVTLLVSGPVGVALAVLVLAAGVVVRRERPRFALLASRGATGRQLRSLRAVEGLACGLPAAVIGAVVARLAVPGASAQAWAWPAVVGLAPVVLLAAAPLSTGRVSRRDLLARRGLGAAEAVVLLAAAASVLLLRRRGLLDSGDVHVDPLLASTPLLLALAAAVVAQRLQPVALRWLVRLNARRPGVTGLVGAARSLREPATGAAAVVAVVTSVGIALFAGTGVATLQQGVADEARRTVGADLRIDGATADSATIEGASVDRVAGLPGVDDVASVRSEDGVPVSVDGRPAFVQVLFVDVAALRRVQAGEPGAVRLPASLDHGDRLSALVSVPAADKLSDDLEIDHVETDVAATVPSADALTSRQAWILLDRDAAERAGVRPGTPQRLLIGTDRPEDVAREVRALGGDTRTIAPAAVEHDLEQAPTITGVRVAALGALGSLGVLSGLAVLLTLARGASERRRQIGLLAALGLPVRRADRILGWEVLPSALVSVAVGVALGLALPTVVLDRVDLAAFTGGAAAPATHLPAWLVPVVAGGVLLLVGGAAATSAWRTRRADLTDVLRMRED